MAHGIKQQANEKKKQSSDCKIDSVIYIISRFENKIGYLPITKAEKNVYEIDIVIGSRLLSMH